MDRKRAYFDNNGTTKMRSEVQDIIYDCLDRGWANPNSQHGEAEFVSYHKYILNMLNSLFSSNMNYEYCRGRGL